MTDDLISRQAAIDEIKKCRFVVDAIEKIRGLPPAQSERKRGKWMLGVSLWYCSECGSLYSYNDYAFCPNCGADMRGGEDGRC